MIVRNIASVLSTKNTSGKIISKVSNSWELNISYLATLGCAVIRGGSAPRAARVAALGLGPNLH
jgi:hypothetical protein